ncbi:hypothetical protein MKEN_01364800 [Mycena kentingensis (nom. inval.)]|nr:hypothetical protein MKEN_01364800 [Mycena kentingensis (nom. inval.)]
MRNFIATTLDFARNAVPRFPPAQNNASIVTRSISAALGSSTKHTRSYSAAIRAQALSSASGAAFHSLAPRRTRATAALFDSDPNADHVAVSHVNPPRRPKTKRISERPVSVHSEPPLPALSVALAAAGVETPPESEPEPMLDLDLDPTSAALPTLDAAAQKKALQKLHARVEKLQPKLSVALRERETIMTEIDVLHSEAQDRVRFIKEQRAKDDEVNAGYEEMLERYRGKEQEAQERLKAVATEEQFKKFMRTFPGSAQQEEEEKVEGLPQLTKKKESKDHLRGGGYEGMVPDAQMIGTC